MASKAVQDAKARLAGVEAKIAAIDAEQAAAVAARKPHLEALEAWRKRQARRPIVVSDSSGVSVQGFGLGFVTPAWGSKAEERSQRKLVEAIVDGSFKLQGVSGQTYTGRGLAQRSRFVSKDALRKVERARRAEQRAADAHNRAIEAHQLARSEAFAGGEKIDVEEFAKVVAKGTLLREAIPGVPDRRWDRQRLEDVDLAEARTHLGHARAVAKGEADANACPCRQCAHDRAVAKAQAEFDARLAEMPKVTRTCSTHGKKRMPTTRVDGEWIGNSYRSNAPILYCPGTGKPDDRWHRLLDSVQLELDKVEAEKARKREALEQRKAHKALRKAQREARAAAKAAA